MKNVCLAMSTGEKVDLGTAVLLRKSLLLLSMPALIVCNAYTVHSLSFSSTAKC